MTASLFGTSGAVNVNVKGTLIPQSFTATDSQTLFTLTAFTYTPGTNSLLVFINGQRQILTRDFTETSTTSFTLLEGCVAGDYVDVIGFPQVDLSSVTAPAVSFTQAGSTTGRTVQEKLQEVVSVKDFGAIGNGIADDTDAIQAAINAVTSLSGASKGGEVFIPPGYYRTTAPILMKHGVSLRGVIARAPGGSYNGSSAIIGDHTGAAILSLKGAHCCRVVAIALLSSASKVPKTGLLLGRNSASSAGLHYIEDVNIEGYFSKAAIYSIASESNLWVRPTYTVLGGGALYGFYTSQGDNLSVDSLTGSSNLENTIIGMEGIHTINSSTMVGVYIGGGLATGTWNFIGSYIIQAGGAYIEINSGAADGLDTLGPITFFGTSGEIYDVGGSNSPTQAFNLTGTTGLCGLTISGGRFEFRNATGAERSLKQASGVTLRQPSINLQTMANATAELQRDKIQDGFVSVGVQAFTALSGTYTNGWSNSFATANGVEPGGYFKDPTGRVHLQGVISSGTVASAAFTLPVGYRPASTRIFSVISNGAIGRFDISSAGVCTLQAGSNVYVSLEGISFKAS